MPTFGAVHAAPLSSTPSLCQQVMRSDVLHAASCGAHGVVLGALTPAGEPDAIALRPFVDLCAALGEPPPMCCAARPNTHAA